jgi:hypothetical protein
MAKSDAKQRTDKGFVKDLDSLLPGKRVRKTLSNRGAKDTVPSVTSFARNAAQSVDEAAGGIASPLTELSGLDGEGASLDRTYHDTDQVITSSDGFFTLVFNNVEAINFSDSQGAQVTINYLDIDPNA